MYNGIALATIANVSMKKLTSGASSPKSVIDILKNGSEKLVRQKAIEKVEADKKKAEKRLEKANREVKKASKKAAKAAKKAEGAFSAGMSSAPEAVVKTAFKAKDAAAAKIAVASVFHNTIAEVLNEKSQAGDFGPGKEDYVSFHRELVTGMVADLKSTISQEDLAFLGGVEALDEFCQELLEVQGMVEEPVQATTVTDVSVKSIDPVPEGMSIRANETVHEVPASMEGLQADVKRLAEKFGK